MISHARLVICALASGLAVACGPHSKAKSGQAGFSRQLVYMVETRDGGIFSSRIADFDSDSLYFLDGTALARAEVASVRQVGITSDGKPINPSTHTSRN